MSRKTIDLLITAFGPFPGMPRNPSADLAKKIAADRSFVQSNLTVRALVIPTTYNAIGSCLQPALKQMQPRAILMLGVASKRQHVSVERLAVNRCSCLMPDASGETSAKLMLEPGGVPMRHARAPLLPMLRALKHAQLRARLSRNAGRYLCNAAYFAALGASSPVGGAARVVFIHVPMPRQAGRLKGRDQRPSLRAMARGLRAAAHEMLRGLAKV